MAQLNKMKPNEVLLSSTGIQGLDLILNGGLTSNRLYLIDGEPGTGKTTLGMQFLLAGARNGERGLYVTLSETRDELEGVAASHGWLLDDIHVYELGPDTRDTQETYTVFHPSEVELQKTMAEVYAAVEAQKPKRIVFDSISEMRMLARDPLRFRREMLALKQFFVGRDCTVLILDDRTERFGDTQIHSIVHGVISLEHIALEYGAERRRLQVVKLRGRTFRGGYHDFRILTGGIEVYPRIVSNEPGRAADKSSIFSGSDPLDSLLGGGIARGTSVLVTGPAGTGKSVLVSQYALAAVARGEKVRFYLFDERISTFTQRGTALAMQVDQAVASGRLTLRQIEPTELSPGEFAADVVNAVEKDGVSIIVLDSINGYLQSMPEERLLPIQVHEMLSYLANNGVSIFMTLVQHGIFGSHVEDAADISYLADTVVLLRYFEVNGAVRQAISVVKKRNGAHERTIREARVGQGGLEIGEPLREFQGVLTGVPEFTGDVASPLMEDESTRPGRRK